MTDDVNALRDRVRRLEADNADLHRDLRDLAALDPDGLQAKVVALHAEAADRNRHVEQLRASLSEECERSTEYYRLLAAAEVATNPDVVAGNMKRALSERDTMARYLRAANETIEHLAGQPVADLLRDYRVEIRALTGRLNDALAALDALHRTARSCVETARVAAYQPCSERPWQEQGDLNELATDARDALAALLPEEAQ